MSLCETQGGMHEIQLTIIAKNIIFQNEVLLIKTTITVMKATKSFANRPKKKLEERKDYQFMACTMVKI